MPVSSLFAPEEHPQKTHSRMWGCLQLPPLLAGPGVAGWLNEENQRAHFLRVLVWKCGYLGFPPRSAPGFCDLRLVPWLLWASISHLSQEGVNWMTLKILTTGMAPDSAAWGLLCCGSPLLRRQVAESYLKLLNTVVPTRTQFSDSDPCLETRT